MNWNPISLYRDMLSLRDEMNRLFGSTPSARFDGRRDPSAPLSVYETPEEYLVALEAPGAEKAKFSVTLTGDTLSIAGEREDTLPEEAALHRQERALGAFRRNVDFPGQVDGGTVDASFQNGVLFVRVAKAEEERPRKINIKV